MSIDYEIKQLLLAANKPISDYKLIKEHCEGNSFSDTKTMEFTRKYCESDYPLQYLVGYEYFFDKKIFVNENVLIPRMETEEVVIALVNRIKQMYTKQDEIKLLDLCTGPGTIIVGISKYLADYNVKYYASDISLEALEVARKNFDYHKLNVEIYQTDLLEYFLINKMKFDIIVSNPPYIGREDVCDDNVVEYEPHLALFANSSGMEFYERILSSVSLLLKIKFILCFEIGYNQGDKISKIVINVQKFNKFDIINDINGFDRIFISFGGCDDSF